MNSFDGMVADGDKVDRAIAEISRGNAAEAKGLLLAVVRNTPSQYFHQTPTSDGGLVIRFWDQMEFVHYVNWKKPNRKIVWNVAVYPRAYFYLGFIAVANRDYQVAIGYLDKALELEPTNPKILLEKAHALMGLKRPADAIKIFEQVSTVGPFTSGADVAKGLRGRAFILIEQGMLDEAEAALIASLELDPSSENAKQELRYITRLRSGEMATIEPITIVTRAGQDLTVCVVCGDRIAQGRIVEKSGSPRLVCQSCDRKSKKKPWEFWR